MSDTTSGAEDFTTLSAALVAWHKYADFPYKRDAATAAFDDMVRRHGQPLRIYVIQSRTYMAITWPSIGMGLQFQFGFMQCRDRLDEAWQPALASPGWWWFAFPDFEDHNADSNTMAVSTSVCPCTPGFVQPVGTECPYCGEVVAPA